MRHSLNEAALNGSLTTPVAGAHHDAVHGHQPERVRGAALPLHAKDVHHPAGAREERAEAAHEQPGLQQHRRHQHARRHK